MGHFTDKVAIVTGAASGIGAALGRELAQNGATGMAKTLWLIHRISPTFKMGLMRNRLRKSRVEVRIED